MARINPFRPNQPAGPTLFAGRKDEVQQLESALLQARAGNPAHFLIIGEPGIGKSSLLYYLADVARGSVVIDRDPYKFLVVDTDLDHRTTPTDLARKIEMGLRFAIADNDKARAFFAEAWKFLQRVEVLNTAIREAPQAVWDNTSIEEFAYSLAQTVDRLVSPQRDFELFSGRFDGLLILIDEADRASADLQIGLYLKFLLERLQRRGCHNVLIGLSGLPTLRANLTATHASSIRLFQEIELAR